jgi:hypothetical protein
MRQILVDHASAKVAAKRGGGRVRVELEETLQYSAEKAAELLALDDPRATSLTETSKRRCSSPATCDSLGPLRATSTRL